MVMLASQDGSSDWERVEDGGFRNYIENKRNGLYLELDRQNIQDKGSRYLSGFWLVQ